MKKLTKEDLTGLSKTLTLIEPNAQRQFIGGAGRNGEHLRISGGTLIDTAAGVDFISDTKEITHFKGVDFSTSYVFDNTAYQLNGMIHISEKWLKNGFNIYDFAHEYGHYLQQIDPNHNYPVTMVKSFYSLLTDPENHHNQPYEKDATRRGEEYLRENAGKGGKKK